MKITGYNPDGGQMSFVVFTIVLDDGRVAIVEDWATEDTAGREVYDEDGTNVTLTAEEDDILLTLMEDVTDKYWKLYNKRVQPLVDEIHKEVFGG